MATAISAVYASVDALGRVMTTETKTKPKQETWREWLPAGIPEPATLLSRAEFLELLQRWHIDATEADLRWWEWEGYLPRPVRQWDPIAKARRAYYPMWLMASVFALRELQHEGRQLRDMAPALRDAASRAAWDLHDKTPIVQSADREGHTEEQVLGTFVVIAGMDAVSNLVFRDEVKPALLRLARLNDRYEQAVRPAEHHPTRKVAVIFTDDAGKERRAFDFTIPRPDRAPSGTDGD